MDIKDYELNEYLSNEEKVYQCMNRCGNLIDKEGYCSERCYKESNY